MLCKKTVYREDQRQVIWDSQIQDEAGFVQLLAWAATGCLLHYFFHVACLPGLIFSIFLEQSFTWDKRSQQDEIYVCKVLWQNGKFCNCSHICALFLIMYLNLQSKQKARIVCTREVRSQWDPLNRVIVLPWDCDLANTEGLIHMTNICLHECYRKGFIWRNVCGTRYIPPIEKSCKPPSAGCALTVVEVMPLCSEIL